MRGVLGLESVRGRYRFLGCLAGRLRSAGIGYDCYLHRIKEGHLVLATALDINSICGL